MAKSAATVDRSTRVGVIADMTGPLSFVGHANANVAKMVIADINAKGGLLGSRVELCLEDSQSSDDVAAAKAEKLVDQNRVDVVLGGILSSTRLAIKAAAVTKGQTLYIYPMQYEGEESDPLIFCTGPVPAQQVEPLIPWLMQETSVRRFYLPSADYIWPRVMNRRVREAVADNGGEIVGEEYHALDNFDYAETVRRIQASGADAVFCTLVPPAVVPFLAELHASGFVQRGGQLVCSYFDDNYASLIPPEHLEGLYSCLDYYRAVQDPFSTRLLEQYNALYPDPGHARFSAGTACTGLYRGLRFWAAAVKEAGMREQDAVVRAMDHARLSDGPGGPSEMVPGQHHPRMNMYIAQARGGEFHVVKRLGVLDPAERALA